MKSAILINGLPASGKSAVARDLSARTGWTVLTLDSIKEPYFDELGLGDRDFSRQLGRAAYAAIWNIVRDGPEGAVFLIDAWFGFQSVEVLERHIARAGVDRVVEVWCHAPGEVLAARYAARVKDRHPGHPGATYAPELKSRADQVAPLGRFPLIDCDATKPLDGENILHKIKELIEK